MESHEKRTRLRFPLTADLRFRVIRRGQGRPIVGSGQAVNMSSKGLAFHTDSTLNRGVRLHVSLAWPAMLDNNTMLRLVVEGTVIRTEGPLVVIGIESYDFRTSGRGTGGRGNARNEVNNLAHHMETLFSARCPGQ